jgi:hypothetical protein
MTPVNQALPMPMPLAGLRKSQPAGAAGVVASVAAAKISGGQLA